MRQKISKLKQTIQVLYIDVDALSSFSYDKDDNTSEDGGKCEDYDEDQEAVPPTRKPTKP